MIEENRYSPRCVQEPDVQAPRAGREKEQQAAKYKLRVTVRGRDRKDSETQLAKDQTSINNGDDRTRLDVTEDSRESRMMVGRVNNPSNFYMPTTESR